MSLKRKKLKVRFEPNKEGASHNAASSNNKVTYFSTNKE